MGRAIAALASRDAGFRIGALVEAKGSPTLGQERHGVRVTDDLSSALHNLHALVDFTGPEAALSHAVAAAKADVPLVVGATGFDEEGRAVLAAQAKKIALVLSPNMSLSANVLFEMTERVAKLLPGYDAEITEVHHNLKTDAPSGTAQRLAEAVQRGRKGGKFLYGRHGQTGERKKGDIGIHSLRGGDVVGDHTVFFFGPGERIELVHRATSREAFAAGALTAVKWVVRQKPGLYAMTDVLGLR